MELDVCQLSRRVAFDWPITGVLKIDEDITIYSLWPHMHSRGKDMTFVLTRPDGKQDTPQRAPVRLESDLD